MERRLTVILAADVVGYSRLMGADEAGTLHALRALESDLIEPAVARHAGRIVKRMGDGYLVEFQSIVSAIDCALQWQAGAPTAIPFRIGINLGDVMVENDDLYGDGVNVAARLEAFADPGGICVSDDAWRYARGKVRADAQDLGEQALKNIDAPVRVFRLLPGDASEEASEEHGPPRQTAFRLRRILLSPFRHLGPGEDAEVLASGLTETLAAALAHFEEFELIDPGAGARAVADEGALGAGRSLGAHYIVEGTVQVAGTRVRIVCQLVDAASGRRVWSETLNRAGQDIFELQDEITAFVASTMGDAVGEEQAKASAHKPITDLSLDELMIRGLGLLHRGDLEGNVASRAIFERVCKVDPDGMLPTLCLAWSHAAAVRNGWSLPRPDSLAYALDLAQGLMRRHPRSAHVHRLLSHILFLSGEHDQGLAHARRAYELNPWHADMMICLGTALMWSGSHQEAIVHLERAFATNPYIADHFKRHLSLAYFLTDRPDDGLAVLGGSEAEAAGSRLHRILNLVARGSVPAAVEEADCLLEDTPDFRAGTMPIMAAFAQVEDRERIVSALTQAGLPA